MRGLRRLVFLFFRPAENQHLVLPTFTILLLRNPGRSKGLGRPLLAFAMMLRFIFWTFLSSASLPFTSQSPLQGKEGVRRAKQIELLQWTSSKAPILAMTSVESSYPWQQKREQEQTSTYQPLIPIAITSVVTYPEDSYQKRALEQKTSYVPPVPIAMTSIVSYPGDPFQKRAQDSKTTYQPLVPIGLTSIITYPGDPYQKRAPPQKTSYLPSVPIIAMTSVVTYPWQKREEEQKLGYEVVPAMSSVLTRGDDGASSQYNYYTRAQNMRRHQTDDLPSMTTTLVTSTREPAKASPNPTSEPNLPLPTISAVPVATKTGLANCNVQGTPSSTLNSNILDRSHAADPISCQLLCMYRSRCEAYSFQESTSASTKNCVFYSTYIDGSKVSSGSSGIYFSDKYPDDGSNFCYGSTEL
jgi:hypothetical protein